MLESVPPVAAGDTDSCGAARAVPPAAQTQKTFKLLANEGISATPPPEVLKALDTLQSAQQELASRGLSVSFDLGADGAVQLSLLDSSGAVIKQYSPAEGLDALSGEAPIGVPEP
jgi:hypothetical protein